MKKKTLHKNPAHEGARKLARQAKALREIGELVQKRAGGVCLDPKCTFYACVILRIVKRSLSPRKKNSHVVRVSQSKRATGRPRTRKRTS